MFLWNTSHQNTLGGQSMVPNLLGLRSQFARALHILQHNENISFSRDLRPEQELHEPAGCFRCHGTLVAEGWLAETHGQQVCIDGCDNVCHYNLYSEDINVDDDVDEGGLLGDGGTESEH